jgi:hypothetical protein
MWHRRESNETSLSQVLCKRPGRDHGLTAPHQNSPCVRDIIPLLVLEWYDDSGGLQLSVLATLSSETLQGR